MKKVVILTTGGTIASEINSETKLLASGAMLGEKLVSMCEIDFDVDIIVESVFQIPSNHMSFEKLLILKKKIEDIFTDKSVDGIVVTHGTDTLEETAYFLDLTISDDRPVVITGSQRGPTELGTDALVNIRQSVSVASNYQCKGIGTLVLFNERIFSARYVRKVHSSNLAAFTSNGFGYLGIVDHDNVYIYQKPVRRKTYDINNPIPKVDIIKFSLDFDGRFVNCSAQTGAEGIIIEGAGRGHISPTAVDSISEVLAKGVKVILTTSCDEGEVYPVYNFIGSVNDLQKRGVIIGKDYDSKKARIKLTVLLAAGIKNIQDEFNF